MRLRRMSSLEAKSEEQRPPGNILCVGDGLEGVLPNPPIVQSGAFKRLRGRLYCGCKEPVS